MLQAEYLQIIHDNQHKSIAAKRLVEEQLDLIYANNWFNIWVPREYGGLGYTLQQGLDLLRELAYVDGAMAWTVTLCSGANMFAGFIEPTKAKEVFQNPKVCFGGSGRVAGKAMWKENCFEVSGMWSFATGAPHLSHFTLNAPIYDGDVQRLDEAGNPVVYSFFVPRDYVLVHYDWDTFGLECTASHSFSLAQVKIDASHAFILSPEKRYVDTALYRIPFMTFAELTLLVNYMGMYRRFLYLAEKYFFEKSKDQFWADKFSKVRFRAIDELQQILDDDDAFVRETTEILWNKSMEGAIEDAVFLDEVSVRCKDIVASIRTHTIDIFPLLGIQAAQVDSELNIVFRNLFTATQHSLLNVR